MKVAAVAINICLNAPEAHKLRPLLDSNSGLFGFDYLVGATDTATIMVDVRFDVPSKAQDRIARQAIQTALSDLHIDAHDIEPGVPARDRIVRLAIHLADIACQDPDEE